MKRVIIILLLVISCVVSLFSQSEWEGRVARGGSQDFPSEGFYAATNSFPRNSIVTVTNPATGKTVRVVVSRGLTDSTMFMTLSSDAARSLGLDGSFPATMKAQPVIIPGVSDQNVGSELPFARDPDINPSASAGDPNAFVFNNQANAQDIRPQHVDAQTGVIQPDSSSVVTSNAQSASSRTMVVTTTTIPSNAANLSQASTVPVSTAASDLDLSASSLIGATNSTIPQEVVSRNAQNAVTAPAPVQVDGGQPANATMLQAAQPVLVAKSDLDANQVPANSVIVNPAKASVAGTDNLIAGTSQGTTGSPALATVAPGSLPNSSAVSTGIASSVQDLRNRKGISGDTTTPPRTGSMQSGIRPSAGLVDAARGQPSTPVPQQGTNEVAVPGATGIDRGIRGMGANSALGTGIGDVARPDHLFDAPPISSRNANTAPIVALPQLKKQTTVSVVADQSIPSSSGTSLLDSQLAGLDQRDTNQSLFSAPIKDGNRDILPPVANTTSTTSASVSSVPGITVTTPDRPDPSLATARSGIASGIQANLPPANAPGVVRADGSLPGVVPENGSAPNQLLTARVPGKSLADPSLAGTTAAQPGAPGTDLPLASVPGQSLADASNPWLEGNTNVAGSEPSLPVAQLFPDQVPQASFAGSAPGLALVPEKSDLPLVALKIAPSQAEAGFSGFRPGAPVTQNQTDLPIAGTKAAANAESGLASIRPVQTVVSLEPADYRPPQIRTPTSDSLAAHAPNGSTVTDAALAEAKLAGRGNAESTLSASEPAATDINGAPLAVVNAPAQITNEALLSAMRPKDDLGNPVLAEAKNRLIPDVTATGPQPANTSVNGKLVQAHDPGANVADTIITGTAPDNGQIPSTLTPAKNHNAENLLPEQTAKPSDTKIVVNPTQPNLPPTGTVANASVTTTTIAPSNRTTTTTVPLANQTGATSEATRILALLNQTGTPSTDNSPPVRTLGEDEQWAQKNLPVVKNLQRNQYYLQVGAFANPRSAKRAIEEVAPGYKISVLPEKSTKQQVYKVFVGPLNEDEKGMVLYLFRAKGYRDAFIQKGQP